MPDGSRYVGIFDDNARDGEGKLFDPLGNLIKEGVFDEPSGSELKIHTFLTKEVESKSN